MLYICCRKINKMEKEFIPYEQALTLKELGFDAECVSRFVKSSSGLCKYELRYGNPRKYNSLEFSISRPLYQQAFRWFREKYDLISFITPEGSIKNRCYLYSIKDYKAFTGTFGQTFEEAELSCLKKLIEIAQKR